MIPFEMGLGDEDGLISWTINGVVWCDYVAPVTGLIPSRCVDESISKVEFDVRICDEAGNSIVAETAIYWDEYLRHKYHNDQPFQNYIHDLIRKYHDECKTNGGY